MARRKRKSPQAILGIILCIPIAFIVYFAISYSSQNISTDSIRSVSMTTPGGEQYTYNDSEQIEFFVNSVLDSKIISTPVRDISNESPVTIQFDRGDKILNYKLYPQLNLSGCMIVDADGQMYLMTADTAESFMVRSELQYLYKDSFLPELMLVSKENTAKILPANYDWYYKKVDGNYYKDILTGVYSPENSSINSVYPNSGSSLKFSVEPDELKISFVTAQGDIIATSDISYLSFTNDTEVEVEINAKWSQLGGAEYYGEATYSFPLLYDIPATVTLEQNTFNTGDVAVVAVNYLNKDEKISVSTTLQTSGIVCYTDATTGKTFALLPIANTNPSGEYTLNFNVGGASYSSTVTVSQPDKGLSFLSKVPDQVFNDMLSAAVIKDANDKFAAIFNQPSQEAYYIFGQKFTAPTSGSVLANYGKDVVVENDATTRKVIGTIYSATDGTAVKSAQKGKVVFAESVAATGNTLIIDHGYGVMTCYFNLKSFDCAVGDIVQQGEIIAYSGSTGYTGGQSILDYAVAVNGVYVNPELF